MARDFPNATTDYLSNAAALASVPFSVAFWVNVDSSQNQAVFAMADEAGGSAEYHMVQIDSLERPRIITSTTGGGGDTLTCAASLSIGTWAHVAAVFAASNDRRIFLNGGDKATSTVSRSPSGLDNTTVGALKRASVTVPLDGKVAELGLWNVALTDEEVASLGKGMSPRLVRPGSLVDYWPLFGNNSPEPGIRGNSLSMTGTVAKSVHPRIFLPHGQK